MTQNTPSIYSIVAACLRKGWENCALRGANPHDEGLRQGRKVRRAINTEAKKIHADALENGLDRFAASHERDDAINRFACLASNEALHKIVAKQNNMAGSDRTILFLQSFIDAVEGLKYTRTRRKN